MNVQQLPVLALSSFNFGLYGCRAILAGHIINGVVEGDNDQLSHSEVTPEFLLLTLIACMIGGSASLFGFVHLKEWTDISRMVTLGMGMMGMMMDILVMGYACKQWEINTIGPVQDLEGRLQFMGIASVVETLTMMFFVGALMMPLKKKDEREDEGGMTDEHHDEEQVEKDSA